MKEIMGLEATILDFLEHEFSLKGYRRSNRLFYRQIPIGRQMIHIAFLRDGHDLSIVVDVAIRHDKLEKKFATVENIKPENRTATIGAELGKLSGQKTIMLTVKKPSDVSSIGNQLLTTLWKVGQPFFETYLGLEKIFDVLVDDQQLGPTLCSIHHVRAKKALVACYLLNRLELYDNLIDSKTQYLQSINSINVPEFLEFAFKLKRFSKNS